MKITAEIEHARVKDTRACRKSDEVDVLWIRVTRGDTGECIAVLYGDAPWALERLLEIAKGAR